MQIFHQWPVWLGTHVCLLGFLSNLLNVKEKSPTMICEAF